MSIFQQKITRHTKRQKIHLKKTEQALEPESDMTGVLELSDQEFLKTIISILRALTKKVDSMQ